MKYLTIFFLALTSCAQFKTSDDLMQSAEIFCKNEPELDMKKYYCEYSYIKSLCNLKNIDVKICGKLESKQ